MMFLSGSKSLSSLFLIAGLALVATLGACSSGSSGGGGGVLQLGSVTGNVREPGGMGLANVTVRAAGAEAVTNVNGDFLLVDLLPSGPTLIELDGTSAGIQFPVLEVTVDLIGGMSTVLPQPITLPDLTNPESANQNVAVDGTGMTTANIAATGGGANMDIVLDGPTGTQITINGAPATGAVDLNVTPVPPNEVPMPLDDGLVASSFVTVQPAGAAFNPPLNITLPNDLGYPLGTLVDIWSFDHDVGDWVNRSTETGQQGEVVDDGSGGTFIRAMNVITEGGWHAPAIIVDADCTTTVTGRIVDSTGAPIPAASVGLSTGQFVTSDDNGDFTVVSVPAYDFETSINGDCFADAVTYEATLPPAFGSGTQSGTIQAGDVMTGGTTTLADFSFVIPATGSVAGLVTGEGATANEPVVIDTVPPTSAVQVIPNESGAFFFMGLDAGDYTASFQHLNAQAPTVVAFTIVANQVTTLNLQFIEGGVGDEVITVAAFLTEEGGAAVGARVTLVGTDPTSMEGIFGITDANGEVVFSDVNGPYTVTVQQDMLVSGETVRRAFSLVDVSPADGVIGIIVNLDDDPEFIPIVDATISGTVANHPGANENLFFEVRANGVEGQSAFNGSAFIDSGSGTFSVSVPSGVPLDGLLNHRSNDFITTLAAQFLSDLGTLTPGQELTLNLDFGSADTFSFGESVDVTTAGNFTNANFGNLLLFFQNPTTGVEAGFTLSTTKGPLPSQFTVMMPDFSHQGLAGLDPEIIGEIDEANLDGLSFAECEARFMSTPTSLALNFPAAPIPSSPFLQQNFTTSELANLTVSFTEGAFPEGGQNGVNQIFVEGDGPGVGIDGISWQIFVPAGMTSVPLPPRALPMFGDNVDYEFGVEQFRTIGTTVDLSSVFDGNVLQNIEMIDNTALSYFSAVEFEIDTEVLDED